MVKIIKNLHLNSYYGAQKDCGTDDLVINCATECDKINDHTIKYDLKDSTRQYIYDKFDHVADYIEANSDKKIIIHCYSGKSRSASFVLAYLMKYHDMPLTDAYEHVREKRKILPNIYFMQQLVMYNDSLHSDSKAFDMDLYIVTFITESFGLDYEQVKKVYMETKNYDRTIDILFPY